MTKSIQADSIFYERQSPRSFTNEDVTEETLMTLFEAARWAPSSFNEQPWRFIYSRKGDDKTEERYNKLFSCMFESNQRWANEAPVLMLTLTKKNFSKNGKSNRHSWHDLGLAMGNLCIQATKMDLIVHQMAGFSQEKAKETFNLPEEIEPVAMVAIGFPAEKKTERVRKPLSELVLKPSQEISRIKEWDGNQV